MRIFETRHGQVVSKKYYNNDKSLPIGDIGLSDLGKEQARLVGQRLKEVGFKGVIFSSPYNRTIETASIIAEELNVKVIPLACLREIVSNVDDCFCGATLKRLSLKYPRVQSDVELPLRWWGEKVEDLSDVIERLKDGLKAILTTIPTELDVLLVGHAATSVALRHLFGVTKNNLDFHLNCHLSLLYSLKEKTYANDCAHLPNEMRTGNEWRYVEKKEKILKNFNAVQRFLEENNGKKVLHIGDTVSAAYFYYKELIDKIKPNVIIHTGDMADELKVGRIESLQPYWIESVKVILNIMEESGARVIIVSGNNDLEKTLRELKSKAEIVERNTVLDLYGKKVLLCHELNRMAESSEADVYLYGHGLTGETRTPNDNARNGKYFYNAVWGASLHCFEEGKSMIIPSIYR